MTNTHHHGNHYRDEQAERRDERRERFNKRLERGKYSALYDPSIQAIIREAAAIQGIQEELGAVRVALAKVLNEVEDPIQLASSVARLATCTAQLLRVVRPTTQEADDAMISTLNQIMVDLEKEARSARAAGRPAPSIMPPKRPYLTRFK